MAFPGAEAEAARLQSLLRQLLGNDAVTVRPHGQHLLLDLDAAGSVEVVARLTRTEPGQYGVSFRRHTGRWDPLPVSGSLDEAANAAVDMLGAFLDPQNY